MLHHSALCGRLRSHDLFGPSRQFAVGSEYPRPKRYTDSRTDYQHSQWDTDTGAEYQYSSTRADPAPGEITVTVEQQHYAPTDVITASIHNGSPAPIYVANHQTSCTIVSLQMQDNSGWTTVHPCRTNDGHWNNQDRGWNCYDGTDDVGTLGGRNLPGQAQLWHQCDQDWAGLQRNSLLSGLYCLIRVKKRRCPNHQGKWPTIFL